MTPLRVAMVGAGGHARRHLEVLARRPDVTLVGHVARATESALRQARRYGGRAFEDVNALLQHEQVDAAWICVPPAAHGPSEAAFVAADVPFLVEKPLSADAATAESIAADVAAAGLVTAVGYHWRALDTLAEVRERLATGPPVRLLTAAWHSSLPAPPWWRREATSGGQIVEQATHLLDLALHLLGDAEVLHAAEVRRAGEVRRECPTGYDTPERPTTSDVDVAEASSATLRFGTGALGIITATWVLAASDAVELRLHREGERITITQDALTLDSGREARVVRTQDDPVATQDAAFLAAVRAGDPGAVTCSYAEALRTHRLAQRVRERARTGVG